MAKAENRPTREDIERDEVAEGLHDAIEGVREHRNTIIIIGLLILLVIVGSWAYSNHAQAKKMDNNALLSIALESYSAWELQAIQEDRDRRFEDALSAIDTLIGQASGTELGQIGLYLKGNLYFRNNQFDEAREAYEAYAAKATNADEKARANIALGYVTENTSFFVEDEAEQLAGINKAYDYYKQAADGVEEDSYLNYYARMSLARLHELKGENQEALDILEVLAALDPPMEMPETINSDDVFASMIVQNIISGENQFRLGATVDLRIERLKALIGDEENVETVTVGEE